MIKAENTWEIIEAAYGQLNGNGDDAVDPNTLEDWDYVTAADEITDRIWDARFPEMALLQAFAIEGYLDNDQIWDEIRDAITRALEGYAEERWQEYLEELDEDEEPED